ncbi:growth/differentiation factor 10b [Trichomycterus rosablanca]|uniref:growth/differentiation factor 10b n=1 Tax=Trichomycterus rosablanca TaxID=2290929 RepID=UPI002F355D69
MEHIWMCLFYTVLVMDTVKAERVHPFGRDEDAQRDALQITMMRLYREFSSDQDRQSLQNTVRSFRSYHVSSNKKVLFYFNLTSIPDTELVLSARLHYFNQPGRQHPRSCHPSRDSWCRIQHPVQLVLQGTSSNTSSQSHLGNITLSPHRKRSWQTSDVSSIVQRARDENELSISAEFTLESQQDRFSPLTLPFIIVHANDLAINEPNSIASSLQRYAPVGEERGTRPPVVASSSRIRREAVHSRRNFLPDIQDNDSKNKELWYNTFFASKSQMLPRSPESRNGASRSQELSFDEKTMKKARRKQWAEPRACARRYLKVDFADIGWSEWILAPKAFDAFYCAGTCGFPLPKMVHPSNHATIQSIVRAVGIVPGVPEPCCVPDEMDSLAVLFFDDSRNLVLKLFPNMSVGTCACR